MRKVWLLIAALIATFMVAAPAAALEFPERIVSFQSEAVLSKDNVLSVAETIDYDFGLTQRHGIFRDIPTRARDKDGQTFYWSVRITSVTDETGQKRPYTSSSNSKFVQAKIGDADKTIMGRHIYKITYELRPLVRQAPTLDVFSFNVTGNGWEVPIEKVSFRLTLPEGLAATAAHCFTGVEGSTSSQCSVAAPGGTVSATTSGALAAGEGISVFADLPSGSFSEYLVAGNRPLPQSGNYFGFVGAALLALLALAWVVFEKLRYRIRRGRETIIALYEPPDKLTPAELGYLLDNKGNLTEVTATLIDLATRGFMKIEQTAPGGLFKKAKYALTKTAGKGTLVDYEQELYGAVFSKGTTVTMDTLDKVKMSAAVTSFQTKLRKRLEDRGYYAKPRRRWPWLLLPLALVVAGIHIVLGIDQHINGAIVTWGALTPIGSAIFGLYAMLNSEPTVAGIHQWASVEGFKDFLTVTEKDRLKFTDAPEKTPKLFSRMLPFATALGVEKDWARQFEGIDIMQATQTWYAGDSSFNATSLSADLGGSFSGAVSSNFSSSSSSSGGSSGGGGGGGGGGSW